MIPEAMLAQGALNTIIGAGKIYKTYNQAVPFMKDTDLISLTHGSRVEPLTIVGSDCVHLEYLPDVLQSLLSIFSGYYLQAVAMTTQINGVSVTRLLDKLNPNRKVDTNGLILTALDSAASAANKYASESHSDWRMSSIAYKHRLPTTKNVVAMAFEQENVDQGMNARDQYWADKNTREQEMHDANYNRAIDEDERKQHDAINKSIKAGQDTEKHEAAMREAKRKEDEAKLAKTPQKPYTQITNDAVKSVRELTDLSVGKMINIEVGGGRDTEGRNIPSASIPISVRLMVNNISNNSLVQLLASGSMDNSLQERYHQWRAGRIEFVRDLVFCQDLIDEWRKAMVHDSSGVQQEILRRVNNAKMAGLANKNPSLNVASNLYVISEVTAAEIEHKLGGKLQNPHTRAKLFDSGYAMIVVVIDRKYEMITFYHRGISTSTTVRLRDIKMSNKGSGPDIGDILKAYQLGSAPSL